jgi:transcriptional regulator with PAS, ATPase and Fis domain
MSRVHARIAFDGGGFTIADLGSRNGTFVDGVQVRGVVRAAAPRVIRVADTLLVPCSDVSQVHAAAANGGGPVVGTKLHQALASIQRAAETCETALILGETGCGKELAAARFHAWGPNARGPFVAVNCAAIPAGLAERLLFGAKRGAYSGATTDTIGHLQAANGGVLFLDEGGELDLQVQAKLLRVLETREVMPLGESRGEKISVRVVVATHRDLRRAVGEGRFRADLYHRIAPPEIVLPPLRERLDEVAAHVVEEIARCGPTLAPQVRLVEACLLRHWPGNVRELRKQIHHAALTAVNGGLDRVRLEHLPATAGQEVTPGSEPPPPPAAPEPRARRSYVRWSQSLTREDVERALAEHQGNVSLTARSLGMQRSQLYREMARLSMRQAPDPHDTH